MDQEAPIVLFVYRRSEMLRRLLEELQRERVSRLIVFADGPKDRSAADDVRAVRALVRAINWAGVEMHESEVNLGLGPSILRGVSQVAARFDSFIVFEDDLEIAPGTIAWIRGALKKFRDDPQVFSVTAWTHPMVMPRSAAGQAYFDARAECWVWGSWARAWQGMDETAEAKVLACRSRGIEPAEFGRDLPEMAARESRDRIWAVRWLCHHLQHGALCLRPPWALADHAGVETSATNAAGAHEWRNVLNRPAPEAPFGWPALSESVECRRLWRAAIDRHVCPSLLRRTFRRIQRGLMSRRRLVVI